MSFKKDFKASALIILLVITAIALFDNARVSESSAELQESRDELVEKVAVLEKEIVKRSITTDELKKDNDRLTVSLSNLEEEVAASQSSVPYQDFNDAISVVEAYKSAGTFQETVELIAIKNGTGFTTLDQEGNCPCGFTFLNQGLIEWSPDVVRNLKEFSIEKGKILLTYHTVENIDRNYQFVLTMGEGFEDSIEKWRIEDIRLKAKKESSR